MKKIITFIIILFLYGCGDYYEEGDEQGKAAFKKMTESEEILYKRVQGEWGQKRLMSIRSAVRHRSIKPKSDQVPFIDIARVIKVHNDVTLVFESNWSTDTKSKCAAARWDTLDRDWFRRIINASGQKEKKHPNPKTDAKTIKPLHKTPNPKFKENKINSDELLSEDDLYDLKYLIGDCISAKNLLSNIIREGRPLIKTDKDELTKRAMFCKATKLRNSLED